jgi:hypothetical protein
MPMFALDIDYEDENKNRGIFSGQELPRSDRPQKNCGLE